MHAWSALTTRRGSSRGAGKARGCEARDRERRRRIRAGRGRRLWLAAVVLGVVALVVGRRAVDPGADVPWVATPPEVIRAMLELAEVGPEDLVYDLGSGDGRIVLTAARDFGARAVGIEIDVGLVARARGRAEEAGLAGNVEFRRGDLFEADLGEASVVTLYLLPTVNRRLRPLLLDDLPPGSRVVSHRWDMGDWKPDAEIRVPRANGGPPARVVSWVIPASAGGTWDVRLSDGAARQARPGHWVLRLWQRFQEVEALVRPARARPQRGDEEPGAVPDLRSTGRLAGRRLELELRAVPGFGPALLRGVVDGDRLTGSLETPGRDEPLEVVGRRRPARLEGTWAWRDLDGPAELSLQRAEGVLGASLRRFVGEDAAPQPMVISSFHVWGTSLYLHLSAAGDHGGAVYTGLVEDDRLIGTRHDGDLTVRTWKARRSGPPEGP